MRLSIKADMELSIRSEAIGINSRLATMVIEADKRMQRSRTELPNPYPLVLSIPKQKGKMKNP